MKCVNCGGDVSLKNGVYICEYCGSKQGAVHTVSPVNVFISYVEYDGQDRRTKDSVIAQNIYNKLQAANISAFYERSIDHIVGEERIQIIDSARHNAKIIVAIGTRADYFPVLETDKIIIPVYADMNANDLPASVKKLQALDYHKVGAVNDLIKNIYHILGREKETVIKSQSRPRKLPYILIIAAIMIVISVYLVIHYQKASNSDNLFSSTEETSDTKYNKSLELIKEENYADAIDILIELGDYKDAKNLLNNCYNQYEGYYLNDDEKTDAHIEIYNTVSINLDISIIDLDNTVIKISEKASISGTNTEISYLDNHNNHGKVTIKLNNKSIELTVLPEGKKEIYAEFLLLNKSDKPIGQEFTREILLDWLTRVVTMDEIKALGYELELMPSSDDCKEYKIKNTDILLAFKKASSDNINMFVWELYTVNASAEILIPEKIHSNYLPFTQDGILYVPGGISYEGLGVGLGEIPLGNSIAYNTSILAITENEFTRLNIIGEYIQAAIQAEATSNSRGALQAENNYDYLYSSYSSIIPPNNYDLTYSASLYKVNKQSYDITYVGTVGAIRGDMSKDIVFWQEIPELAAEFDLEYFSPSASIQDNYGYILSDSSTRYLTKQDLLRFTKDELRFVRNEIYARHGRKFQSQDLQDYFNAKDWYHPSIAPNDFTDNMLNDYERANAILIREAEKER